MVRALVATLVLAAAAGPAHAWDFAVDTGFVEVMAVPSREHVGLYPYLGVSFVVPLHRIALVPGLSVEAAPESGRWGLVASLVADLPVHQRLGLDVDVTLIHDQSGTDIAHADFLLGAGAGFSVFLGRWTLSPYVNIFRDLVVDGWAVVPGLNLAATVNP
jgi:hypothetical protein